MNIANRRDLAALGFWAKHVDAMDWIYENYYEEEHPPTPPASLKALFASEEARSVCLRIIGDAVAEQKAFLTDLKSAVFNQIAQSSVVRTKAASFRQSDWDFFVECVSRSGKKTFHGALCAYLHTGGTPASLRLTTTLWLPSAKRQEQTLADMLRALTGADVTVTKAQFPDWDHGSVLLGTHPLSGYWSGDTSVLDGGRLMSDALMDLCKIDDCAWKVLLSNYGT